MKRVAVKGLLWRKVRGLLTAIAIVLGVALVSGAFILSDTLRNAADSLQSQSYSGIDGVVAGRAVFETEEWTKTPPISDSLVAKIRAVPEVGAAIGGIVDQARLVGADGDVIGQPPNFAIGFNAGEPGAAELSPLELVEGRWAARDGEVVIGAGTADGENLSVGDPIGVVGRKASEQFRIVGISTIGDVESLGTATTAAFDLATAQRLLEKEGQVDSISFAAANGVSADKARLAVTLAIPESLQVQTADAADPFDFAGLQEFVDFIKIFLLAFGGIALFVGAFIIFNTFSITVAQRAREFALLRTIGASRRQVLTSVLLEALLTGIFATAIGIVAGYGIAEGLQVLMRAINLDLPAAGTVFALRTVLVSLLVGVVVTVVAGIVPAVRATRVEPVAVLREGSAVPPSRLTGIGPYLALAGIALGVSGLVYGMFGDNVNAIVRALAIGLGVLVLFLGVALFARRVVPTLARLTSPVATWAIVLFSIVVYPLSLSFWLLRYGLFEHDAPRGRRALAAVGGLPFLPFGAVMWLRTKLTSWRPEWPLEFPNVRPELRVGKIGKQNAMRAPGRTAATAAALMIGLALVTFAGVLGKGMQETWGSTFDKQVAADYVLSADQSWEGFSPAAVPALARVDGVEAVSSVRFGQARVEATDSEPSISGVDTATIARFYRFDWKEGSDETLATLGESGAVVLDNWAEDNDVSVGEVIALETRDGDRLSVSVRGIYKPKGVDTLLGDILVSASAFDRTYQRPRNGLTFVDVREGADRSDLEAAVKPFPDTKFQTQDEFVESESSWITDMLTLIYALLGLSVIVSFFGIVNTLVLSTYERTRELGMLRAVGMTRRQVRRMVRHESVITALIGAVLGIVLGIALAALVTRRLSEFSASEGGDGMSFSIPILSLVVFAVIAVVAGIVAALLPARRAARLDVLKALQYE